MPNPELPNTRTPRANGSNAIPVAQLNWGSGIVLSVGSPGAKSASLFPSPIPPLTYLSGVPQPNVLQPGSVQDGMVYITGDANVWYTIAGFSTAGVSAGAGVGVAGSAYLAIGQQALVYVPNNAIIGAIGASGTSGNLSVVPALMST